MVDPRQNGDFDIENVVLGSRRDIYDSAGKKSQELLTFPARVRRDSLSGRLFRLEYPDTFYVGR